MKACLFCAEEIQDAATVCKHCGRELVHQTTPEEEARAKSVGLLEQSILNYTSAGWVLVSRTDRMAQLKKPKQFNWLWFFFWLIIGIFAILLPLILYLIYYAVKKDDTVTLTISDTGEILVNGMKPTPKPVTVATTVTAPVDNRTPEEKKAANKRTLIILGIVALVVLVGIPLLCAIINAIANSSGY